MSCSTIIIQPLFYLSIISQSRFKQFNCSNEIYVSPVLVFHANRHIIIQHLYNMYTYSWFQHLKMYHRCYMWHYGEDCEVWDRRRLQHMWARKNCQVHVERQGGVLLELRRWRLQVCPNTQLPCIHRGISFNLLWGILYLILLFSWQVLNKWNLALWWNMFLLPWPFRKENISIILIVCRWTMA